MSNWININSVIHIKVMDGNVRDIANIILDKLKYSVAPQGLNKFLSCNAHIIPSEQQLVLMVFGDLVDCDKDYIDTIVKWIIENTEDYIIHQGFIKISINQLISRNIEYNVDGKWITIYEE